MAGDLFHPVVRDHVQIKQEEQKEFHDKSSHYRNFEVGHSVLIKNVRSFTGIMVNSQGHHG